MATHEHGRLVDARTSVWDGHKGSAALARIKIAADAYSALRAAAERPSPNYETHRAIQDARDSAARWVEHFAFQLESVTPPAE